MAVEVPWEDPTAPELNLAVRLSGYLDTGLVEQIHAPSANFGA